MTDRHVFDRFGGLFKRLSGRRAKIENKNQKNKKSLILFLIDVKTLFMRFTLDFDTFFDLLAHFLLFFNFFNFSMSAHFVSAKMARVQQHDLFFCIFGVFDIHRQEYRCHWHFIKISGPWNNKRQATGNVLWPIRPFLTVFEDFQKAFRADWQIYGKRPQNVDFCIFSVFLDV